jgi:4-aminobutyrate aminotransferase / (S)-3-amino-2-methylpropionate transaminase / 5-aminovalerate transaminase
MGNTPATRNLGESSVVHGNLSQKKTEEKGKVTMTKSITNKGIADRRGRCFSSCYASAFGCYVDKAKGALLWDVEGKEYIDFAGGIGGMNVGHSHPKVVKAIQDQAERFTHTCLMVAPYEPAVQLAEKLCKAAPGRNPKAVAYVTSGAEAVENAIKIARVYTKRTGVVALGNAYHGRTMMTMAMTGRVMPFKAGFGPFAPEVYTIGSPYCYRCPIGKKYPSCDAACADLLSELFVKEVAAASIACMVMEPVLGEGGFIVPPKAYVQKVKAICEENGILFVSDEIQAGMARTGKMFAIEHFDVVPDLITTAKSLAAGMPIAAVVGTRKIMDSVHPGGVGGTYSGNPLACAAGVAVFDILKSEDLFKRADTIGKKVKARFKALQKRFKIIGDVRGIGAMVAMELVHDKKTKAPAPDLAKVLTSYCFKKGLLLLATGTCGNVIRILSPLVITNDQLEKGLEIIEGGFASICK